mmetsp:Transcript_35960/g.72152  ORF Transcript_35960/g.72152 Transcript_35960/m.72152 type:complete len:114 (+) Transcript_35960:29-370(+)
MASKPIFEEVKKKVESNPAVLKKVKAVYEWQLTNGGETIKWTMDFKNGAKIQEGAPEKADCTIIMSEEDFVKMMQGATSSQALFLKGKMKVKGGLQHAMKLGEVQKLVQRAKL